jgi:hypothetical protein
MDCVMNERGVALVPGLNSVPDFNLEQELESAASFVIEPVGPVQKNSPKPYTVSRQQLDGMIGGASAAVHDEHEDE